MSETELHWDKGAGLRSFAAEAAVAHHLAMLDPEGTRWTGGNKKGMDASGAGLTVDAKRGFVQDRDCGHGVEPALGFMGTSRDVQVRDGITHYGIGLVTGEINVVTDRDGTVRIDNAFAVTVYLFPADVVNGQFLPYLRPNGVRSKGLNRYIPLREIEQYRVIGPVYEPPSAGSGD